MAETTTRNMMFSIPEGGEVVITYPEPMTPESILMIEELCALWFRGLRRRAIQRQEAVNAEEEYDSWFPIHPSGVTEVPGMPSDCLRINCRREWAGGEKCPVGVCEYARGVTEAQSDAFLERALLDRAVMTPEQEATVRRGCCPKCMTSSLGTPIGGGGVQFKQCLRCHSIYALGV